MEREQALLEKGLFELSVNVPAGAIDRFLIYLAELKKWNKAYNLTALKDDRDIIIKHFFDSLLFIKIFPENAGKVCDVGSGAGFPGVPVSIIRPDIQITLIEPSRKKCAFLRNLKQLLSLHNVSILESRVEDIEDYGFNTAVTRALFTITEFIAKTKHTMAGGGSFILNKGPKYEDELGQLPASAQFLHIPVVLPSTSIQRHLIRVTI